MVEETIGQLDRCLASMRPDYYACLQPGATDAQLDAFEAQFTLKLPDAFRALFRWRNGQADQNYKSLQKNRMFSSLESVADSKALLDGMIESDFDSPEWWRRGWVPFLSNGGGSHLCVDVTAEGGGQPGQLVAFWKSDEDRPIEYPSIEAWLADLVNSMEAGELKVL